MKDDTAQQLIVTLAGLRGTEELILQEMMIANNLDMEKLGVDRADITKIQERRKALVDIHDKIIADMMKEFRLTKGSTPEKRDA